MLKIIIKRLFRPIARPIAEFCGLRSKIAVVESDLNKSKTLIISFTGGMGAQILSAAILFDLKSKGYSVKADLDYFKKNRHVAIIGNKNEVSHWDWQLDDYGLTMETIRNYGDQSAPRVVDTYYLPDGHLKARLAMQALKQPQVKEYFKMPNDTLLINVPEAKLLYVNQEPYGCIHIRRGDYINSTSHIIVTDDKFIQLSEKFKHLVNTVVIVSDALLKSEFKYQIKQQFKRVIFLDGATVNPFVTHCIMRNSKILVCSNSQYSLSAGVLHDGLVIIPKVWLSVGHEQLKLEIEKFSDFSVLS